MLDSTTQTVISCKINVFPFAKYLISGIVSPIYILNMRCVNCGSKSENTFQSDELTIFKCDRCDTEYRLFMQPKGQTDGQEMQLILQLQAEHDNDIGINVEARLKHKSGSYSADLYLVQSIKQLLNVFKLDQCLNGSQSRDST